MSSSLEGLYQQVILDHAKEKHGRGRLLDGEALPEHSARSHQYNPLCGDEVTLQVTLSGTDESIAAIIWDGEGCSISQAATSVLHDLVVDHSLADARATVSEYRHMLRNREYEADEDVLGDAVAFAGVSRHANRVKCAILGWTAFEDALIRAEGETQAQPGTSGKDDR